jgi:DNA-binding XRE family transcriptional regulator
MHLNQKIIKPKVAEAGKKLRECISSMQNDIAETVTIDSKSYMKMEEKKHY